MPAENLPLVTFVRFRNQGIDKILLIRHQSKTSEHQTFQILRRAQETLTFKDGNGNDELILGQSDYYNLGVVSWMLFKNFKRFD